MTSTCIAVPGTTASDWDNGAFLETLKIEARTHDYVWIMLGGNDALDFMPDCAESGKTAAECGKQLFKNTIPRMTTILDSVHKVNPKAKVVGFGYDTMFGGVGCGLVTHEVIPQCYKRGGGGNKCFNTQFIQLQEAWETLASNRTWLTAINLLGTTQMAAGYPGASIGHPDMDKMGPAKYWPDYEGCFHPGVVGGEDSGAMVIMEEFYKQYWSKEFGC